MPGGGSFAQVWLPRLTWGVAILMVALMGVVIWQRVPALLSAVPGRAAAPAPTATPAFTSPASAEAAIAALPALEPDFSVHALVRASNPRTVIPDRPRSEPSKYTVEKGDSIFGIAKSFNLKPESVLWANYDTLNDDPQMIEIGLPLTIPPTDGVYYKWQAGDTLDDVATRFKVKAADILLWPGNKLDLTDPKLEAGQMVMIPNGWRKTEIWVVPTIWRSGAGANKTIAGGCAVGAGGAMGTGYFVWPTINHFLSGNDFWDGHLGLDIAGATGAPVYATDSGVVVYAAPIGGGYGNMIQIDHGNGYSSVYAHLSAFLVSCGQSVAAGQRIGMVGSTGNSTGPHLHFEIRYFGQFINPWQVLP